MAKEDAIRVVFNIFRYESVLNFFLDPFSEGWYEYLVLKMVIPHSKSTAPGIPHLRKEVGEWLG